MPNYTSKITIDLAALQHNVNEIKRLLGDKSSLCAVVKADAYGHGAIPIAKKLERLNLRWLAVANITEAIELREDGMANFNILLLGYDYISHLKKVQEYDLTPAVFSLQNLRLLVAHINTHKKIHLEIDSGMGRTGLLPQDIPEAIQILKHNPNIYVEGVFTHFACADEIHNSYNEQQIKIFDDVILLLENNNIQPKYIHSDNSAAIIAKRESRNNIARVGLSLYGIPAIKHDQCMKLKPILHWATKPLLIKQLLKGKSVSYGATWTASKESTVAIIPIGYADGYSRLASNIGVALVKGRKVPIIGKICMDFMMLDVTECSGITLEDDVVLIGQQGNKTITLQDLADWAQTIPYEIMCNIGKRSKYIYVDKEQ